MRILYCPQLSMYDKKTKRLTPQADGNINMLRNFIVEWKKYRTDDSFFILLPSELNGNVYMADIMYNTSSNPIYYRNYVISSRVNRFNFPMHELISLFSINPKFDLIITDVIELANNFKQMFKTEFSYTPKIISNIHHLDDNTNYDYIYRVIEGIEHSNYITILSDSMKSTLGNQMSNLLHETLVEHFLEKIQVFEPSISKEDLMKYKSILVNKKEKKIITFPGRLSKGEENRTNWDKFQDAIIKLREERDDFELYLTDPNNSMTEDLKENLLPWIKTINKDRQIFLNLLDKTDIVVSLMDIQGFGGISIREALLFGCTPIIPYKHEYIKMAPKSYEGFIQGNITSEKLVDKLNWALDNCNLHDYTSNGMQFTIERQMRNLMTQLEVILNEE